MSDTGVVIVSYNSAGVIGACLESCAGMSVVVVDNASNDGTVEQVRAKPAVKLIANTRNLGFAAAVNQGVAALRSETILLLNPDVELQTPVTELAEAIGQSGIGLAAGKLVAEDGKVQRGFTYRRFPAPLVLAFEVLGLNRILKGNPANRRYRCLDADLESCADVDQPAGAFLMFRRQVWQQLGGFDESFYPLWFEDVDFCKRAKEHGWRIRYVPRVEAKHRGGNSISKLAWGCREVYWYVSLLRYASKHFRPSAYRGVSVAVVLGSVIRAVAGVFSRRSFEPVVVYAKVLKIAALCLVSGRIGDPA